MPRLDTMLRALSERGAHELRLTAGNPPVFLFGEETRPVSRTALQRAQILQLTAELAGEHATAVASGKPTRFAYRLDATTRFVCDVSGTNGDFAVRIVPESSTSAATDSPPASVPASASSEHTDGTAPATESAVREPSVENAPVATATGGESAEHVDALLHLLVAHGGSDLHLSAEETPMLRVDGEMARLDGQTERSPEATSRLLFGVMPPRNREEFERTGDTDFAYEIDGLARFRVNVFNDRKGVGGVFRVIPSKILTAEDLALPKPILDLCQLSKGLVLVTGPTGSGKSTTLAAMVDYINGRRTDHIITIEDPIEFVHPNRRCLVNQREVMTHTQSFKKALRAALREDPDIVLVGELRDLETIEIAIETAETGHLVFGTLHTTTACSTVDRIIDQFPADRQSQIRTMLSESLKGVVAQTLLRKNGGGRVAALEILVGIPAIANLIREGKTFQIPSIMQTGKKHGMRLLNDALIDLVKTKVVLPEEAYAKAADRTGFASMLRAAGISVPGASEV